jgi:hypothetical protein
MGTPAHCRSTVNIYADSKYAFTTIHVHGVLYKERGLINQGGKNIKYGQKNPQNAMGP